MSSLLELFSTACAGFERRVRAVCQDQWERPTPCAEWNVRALTNHVVRGNLNYVQLLRGGTGADFLRLRDADALGADPVAACLSSAAACAATFAEPGAFERKLDYPLGVIKGRQAIAIRITDITVHTWDLAHALGLDERLDPGLVEWIADNLHDTYAGLDETPASVTTTFRFFSAPADGLAQDASSQARLLNIMGR